VNRLVRRAAAALIACSMAACATPPTKEQTGTVLGGVGGGVIGSQIGRGTGRTVGIIAGTLIGALIGKEIGRSIDRTDELKAQQVLESNRTGQASSWVNPDTGNEVTVVPTKTYQVQSGQYCREYQTDVIVGGEKERAYGTACRQADGSWKIVSQH
jgi:surface antigen